MLVEHLSDREKNDLIFILTLRAILSLPNGKIFIVHKSFIHIDQNSNKKILILISRSQEIFENFLKKLKLNFHGIGFRRMCSFMKIGLQK